MTVHHILFGHSHPKKPKSDFSLLFWFLFIILIFICALKSFGQACGGEERWSQKIMTDSIWVNTIPIQISIPELIRITPPAHITNNLLRQEAERQVYSVDCIVLEYFMEEDGDYHLVIAEPSDTTITMIAEIPNPFCESVQHSKFIQQFTNARINFLKYTMKRHQYQRAIYTITGTFFFDKPHRQRGLAPNGAELHPVLSFQKL